MCGYQINFTTYFNDDEAWLIEAKGCLEIDVHINQKTYRFNFYDQMRLNQEISDALERSDYFFEENVVILEVVNQANMINFLDHVVGTAYMNSFKPQD